MTIKTNVIDSIRKNQIKIMIIACLIGVFFYKYTSSNMQSYTARVMIEYTGQKAAQGYNPDGTKTDVSEIYQPVVMQRALDSIGYKGEIDSIRKSIQVDELVSDDEYNVYDSKVKLGEEYEIIPTRYVVSLVVSDGGQQNDAFNILNAIISEYTKYYAENHVNTQTLQVGLDKNIVDAQYYDYIETAEMIDDTVEDTLQTLSSKIGYDDTFRQQLTGYSFTDLYRQLSLLRSCKNESLMAEILQTKATKDKQLLIQKYQQRNRQLSIESGVNRKQIDDIREIMAEYVEKMKDQSNVNLDSDFILNEIYSKYDGTGSWQHSVDHTTQYDDLINKYVQTSDNYNNDIIDYAYNEYVIQTFQQTDETAGNAVVDVIKSTESDIIDELNELLRIANDTNEEFNSYLGAQNISVIQNVQTQAKMPIKKLTILVIIFQFLVILIGQAVIQRLLEILKDPAVWVKALGAEESEDKEDQEDHDFENRQEAGYSFRGLLKRFNRRAQSKQTRESDSENINININESSETDSVDEDGHQK